MPYVDVERYKDYSLIGTGVQKRDCDNENTWWPSHKPNISNDSKISFFSQNLISAQNTC